MIRILPYRLIGYFFIVYFLFSYSSISSRRIRENVCRCLTSVWSISATFFTPSFYAIYSHFIILSFNWLQLSRLYMSSSTYYVDQLISLIIYGLFVRMVSKHNNFDFQKLNLSKILYLFSSCIRAGIAKLVRSEIEKNSLRVLNLKGWKNIYYYIYVNFNYSIRFY